jgi:UDP-glucuronate 4-epimerase
MRVIELLEKALGRKAEIRFEPMQPGDVKESFADIDDIARDLGYAPTTSIDEGIPKFIAWYREYHGI